MLIRGMRFFFLACSAWPFLATSECWGEWTDIGHAAINFSTPSLLGKLEKGLNPAGICEYLLHTTLVLLLSTCLGMLSIFPSCSGLMSKPLMSDETTKIPPLEAREFPCGLQVLQLTLVLALTFEWLWLLWLPWLPSGCHSRGCGAGGLF